MRGKAAQTPNFRGTPAFFYYLLMLILQWLSSGMTEEEILEDYPELQKIHIKAALAFAAERDAMTKVIVHETVA